MTQTFYLDYFNGSGSSLTVGADADQQRHGIYIGNRFTGSASEGDRGVARSIAARSIWPATGWIWPPSTCRERQPTTAPFRLATAPRNSPERSAERGPSRSSTTTIFSSTSSVSSGQTIDESRRGRAHPRAGAEVFRHDQRSRDFGETIDAANFLLSGTTFDFVEFGGDGRHAHPDRHDLESDRPYPHDRPLFEVGFHPRPRPRDRHPGEVRGMTKATVRERAFGE